MLAVSESCREASLVPQISWALGASLMDAQTPEGAEEETSAGPGALWRMETHTLCPGRIVRP